MDFISFRGNEDILCGGRGLFGVMRTCFPTLICLMVLSLVRSALEKFLEEQRLREAFAFQIR